MRISDWSSDVCSADLRVIGDVDTARSPCCRQCCAAQQFTPFHIHVSCPPEKIQLAGLSAYTKWPPTLQVGSTHFAFGPDRTSVVEGKRVSVRVNIGGRRILTKKLNSPTIPEK